MLRRRILLTKETPSGFVDLGLPSGRLWAKGNLVKDSQGNYTIGDETDWGTYVSWGNIDGHNEGEGYDFSLANYNSSSGASVSADIPSNDASHDICFARLGSPWFLPTKSDFYDLIYKTDKQWVANYNGTGIKGYKFMNKSDHSIYIFLPASGLYNGTTLEARNSMGFYWSSNFKSAVGGGHRAYPLYFRQSSISYNSDNGCRYGMSIRPVQ